MAYENPYTQASSPKDAAPTEAGRMPLPVDSRPPLQAGDNLPEVEPPSATFLLQLFVVPAIIVASIVGLMLLFTSSGGKVEPQAYIRQIRLGRANSWQAANDLASEMRRNQALRQDPALVAQLAGLLVDQLKIPFPQLEDHSPDFTIDRNKTAYVTQVSFLCKAIAVCSPLPEANAALHQALTYQAASAPDAYLVRAAAAESLYLAFQNNPELWATEFEAALRELSRDPQALVRLRVVYTLGLLPKPTAETVERVTFLLDDPDENVRFNAATAMSRWGNPGCEETLLEMLQAHLKPAPEKETSQAKNEREARLTVVLDAAIGGAVALAQQNPALDRERLIKGLGVLTQQMNALPTGAREHLLASADTAIAVLKKTNPKPGVGNQ